MAVLDNLIQGVQNVEDKPNIVYTSEAPEQEVKQESDMSTMEALALQFNLTYQKLKSDSYDHIANRNRRTDNNIIIDNYIDNIKDQETRDAMWESRNDFTSIPQIEARLQYIKDKKEAVKVTQDRLGTVGTIAAGLPMAIVDPVLAPMMVASDGLYAGARIAELGTVARTAYYGGEGALYGYAMAEGEQAITGINNDQQTKDAILYGSLLNIGAGHLLRHTESPRAIHTDANGNVIPTNVANDLKNTALNNVRDDISRVDEALRIENEIIQTASKHSKESTKIVEKVKEELDIKVTTLESASKKLDDDVFNDTAINRDLIKETKATASELSKEVTLASKLTKAIDAVKAAIKPIVEDGQVKLEQLLKDKAELELRLKPTEGIHPGATSIIKQMEKNNSTVRAKLEKVDKEIASLNKQLSSKGTQNVIAKATAKINKLTNQLNETNVKVNKLTELHKKNVQRTEEATAKRTKLLEEAKSAKKAYTDALKVKNEFDKKWTKSDMPMLQRAKMLADKAARAEDVAKILTTKGLLTDAENKMLKGDFSLADLRVTYVDRLDSLAAEANKIGAVVTNEKLMAQLVDKVKLNPIMQKLLISPVEKVKSSTNLLAAGLMELLHSGTINRGKTKVMNAKYIADELHNELINNVHHNIRKNWIEASRAKKFTGSFEEFSAAVGEETTRVVGQMKKDALKGIPGGLKPKAFREAYEANLLKANRKFSDDTNKFINDSVNKQLDYYESIWKRGNSLEMLGFKHSIGKAYIPRLYSATKLEELGGGSLEAGALEAIKILTNAQIVFAQRFNKNVTEDMINAFQAKSENAIKAVVDGTDAVDMIVKPFVRTEDEIASLATGRMKERQIEVFDDDIAVILESDSLAATTMYGLSMHGRIALKEMIGIETSKELDDLFVQIGANKADKENIAVVVDTILGRREMVKDPTQVLSRATKGLSSMSSVLHTGSFGIPTLTEITSITKEYGFFNTMKNLIPAVRDIRKMYKDGTVPERNGIKLVASYGDALLYHKATRYEAESLLANTGKVQSALDRAVNKLSIWGGLAPITDILRLTAQTANTEFIVQASLGKIKGADLKRLGDMGLGSEELAIIRKTLDIDDAGNINNMDRSTWGKAGEMLDQANHTTLYRTILHPDGATLPKLMTNYDLGGLAPRIFFKFMRFPVESWERLALRGLQEMDAKQVMSVAVNSAMWYYILMAKDAMKPEEEQKYNLDTEEGRYELYKDAMLNNSATSAPIVAANYASQVATGRTLKGYPGSLGAPTGDYARLVHRGQLNIGMYGYTEKIDIGEAVSNIMNWDDALHIYSEAMED